MPNGAEKAPAVDRRIIRVSDKRQITIPLKYYKKLGLGKEVECSLEGDAIVIRPIKRHDNEFSVEILKDLVAKGYSGNELVKQFEAQSKKIKTAVANLLEEAEEIAAGQKKAATFEDIFGSED
ncbi:MAG: AbrB/MazE/SpoVT family DNA-binding domain-containing protein [bacterium]|jgi:bifunctional DNA-binding transcriptional regulator/antitoxin component of YhaV-PrlF toxin-antitoxin module|nr:AbrB/MazE/SpoVT family DNA-binding domain-containing protein [Bacillota bacterium]